MISSWFAVVLLLFAAALVARAVKVLRQWFKSVRYRRRAKVVVGEAPVDIPAPPASANPNGCGRKYCA